MSGRNAHRTSAPNQRSLASLHKRRSGRRPVARRVLAIGTSLRRQRAVARSSATIPSGSWSAVQPTRTTSVAAVNDGEPPASPLERAGVSNRHETEAATGQPTPPGGECLRQRPNFGQLRQVAQGCLGDRRQARGEAAHQRAARSVCQADLDHVGSMPPQWRTEPPNVPGGCIRRAGVGSLRRPPRPSSRSPHERAVRPPRHAGHLSGRPG